MVLVVSRRRARAILEAPPSWTVALGELLIGAIWVRQVPGGEYRARYFVQLFGCGFRTLKVVATCDVPGSHEHGDRPTGRRVLCPGN